MTVYSALISFAVVAGLLTIIPGIDTALVVRAAVSEGRRAGFVTALGIGSGTLVWGAAAAIGVSALLTASRLGYDVLRLAGAGYLLTLGATMLCQSRRRRHPQITPAASGPDAEAEADHSADQRAPVIAPAAGWTATASNATWTASPAPCSSPSASSSPSRGPNVGLPEPCRGSRLTLLADRPALARRGDLQP
jgi:threonine/homoserine/homoserine lactone efflux protein